MMLKLLNHPNIVVDGNVWQYFHNSLFVYWPYKNEVLEWMAMAGTALPSAYLNSQL